MLIAGALLGALLGELVSWLVLLIRGRLRRSAERDLVGLWHSIYRSDFRDNTNLVQEEVHVTTHLGKVRMRNSKNPSEDSYEVEAELIRDGHLVGTWRSLKAGAHARGAMILMVSPLGDVMYGFFTGLGNTGERTYCSWILVRSHSDIEKAAKLLVDSVLALPSFQASTPTALPASSKLPESTAST